MNEILEILKSINYWTIAVSLAALISSYIGLMTYRKTYLNKKADVLSSDSTESKNHNLLQIIKNDDLKKFKKQMKNGILISTKIESSDECDLKIKPESLLHHAARNGSVNIAKYLISKGIYLESKGHFERTPFAIAIEKNNYHFAELLLRSGANIDAIILHNRSISDWEVSQNNIDSVDFLLKNGANIEQQSSNGSLLHKATSFGYLNMVKLLIKHGVNQDTVNSKGENALYIAEQKKYDGIVSLLRNKESNN